MSRLDRRNRKDLDITEKGGMFDMTDNMIKSMWRINDEELNFISERLNDEDIFLFTSDCLKFSEAKRILNRIDGILVSKNLIEGLILTKENAKNKFEDLDENTGKGDLKSVDEVITKLPKIKDLRIGSFYKASFEVWGGVEYFFQLNKILGTTLYVTDFNKTGLKGLMDLSNPRLVPVEFRLMTKEEFKKYRGRILMEGFVRLHGSKEE